MGSKAVVRPARLSAGSRIALVAPSGPLLERDELSRAEELCRELGYDPSSAGIRVGAMATSPAPMPSAWPI